jgi:hypothetical protein
MMKRKGAVVFHRREGPPLYLSAPARIENGIRVVSCATPRASTSNPPPFTQPQAQQYSLSAPAKVLKASRVEVRIPARVRSSTPKQPQPQVASFALQDQFAPGSQLQAEPDFADSNALGDFLSSLDPPRAYLQGVFIENGVKTAADLTNIAKENDVRRIWKVSSIVSNV